MAGRVLLPAPTIVGVFSLMVICSFTGMVAFEEKRLALMILQLCEYVLIGIINVMLGSCQFTYLTKKIFLISMKIMHGHNA